MSLVVQPAADGEGVYVELEQVAGDIVRGFALVVFRPWEHQAARSYAEAAVETQ